MAVKDVVAYYNEVATQYLDMKHELADFTELAKEGMFEPERLEMVEKQIQPLKRNYETLSYIMFLLNKPTRKSKQSKYANSNKKKFSQMRTKQEVITENSEALASLKAVKQEYSQSIKDRKGD